MLCNFIFKQFYIYLNGEKYPEKSFIDNQITGGGVISEKPIPKEEINPFSGLDGEEEEI